jgi:hypothetical protein
MFKSSAPFSPEKKALEGIQFEAVWGYSEDRVPKRIFGYKREELIEVTDFIENERRDWMVNTAASYSAVSGYRISR